MTKQEIQQKIETLETEISILNQKQYSYKILLNSGYGALANKYFVLYDIRLAKSITYTSQLVAKWISQYIEEKIGLKSIYGDTDSRVFSVEPQLRKLCIAKNIDYETLTFEKKRELLNVIGGKISEVIKEGYDVLQNNLNVYEKTFEMNRELLGDAGIWLGKKMYCIKMIDKDGVFKSPNDKPYVKGFSIAAKSANPKWVIDKLTEYLELIFTGNKEKVIEFEKKTYKEFLTLSPNDFCFIRNVRSMNNHKTVDSKGAQAHIKGALTYNDIVQKNNLTGIYPLIREGDKIRFCYILEPNKLNSNSIAYAVGSDGDKFFEYAKSNYNIKIDYQKQWDTIFISPTRRLTDAVKWNMQNINKANFSKFLTKKT